MLTQDPVVALCLAALAAAALWACLVSACVVVEVWRARRQGRRVRLRQVVLTCCGVALAVPVGQASADDRGLAGLPMPDRAIGPARHHAPPAPSVVVRPGDCLWHLAARDLPVGATHQQVTTRWRAIYRLNRALIGPDPDVIEPGQRLVLPLEAPR